jgi:hypothetical protein
VDYSLFMTVSMAVMSERLEKRPRATPTAFPLPIFDGMASVSMFHVSPPPHLENTEGVSI